MKKTYDTMITTGMTISQYERYERRQAIKNWFKKLFKRGE